MLTFARRLTLASVLGASVSALAWSAVSPSPPAARSQATSALAPSVDNGYPLDFLRERQRQGTHLIHRGSAPEFYKDPPVGEGMRLVRFASAVGELKAWVLMPQHTSLWNVAGYPALIYAHDSRSVSQEELEHAEEFQRAGMLVVVPAWRGENGNPGEHELLFGELDDLADAVRYAATLPETDVTRLAVFGHGLGGMLSALVSLVPGLPLRDTASSAGLRAESSFEVFELPFEDTTEERQLRLLGPHLYQMRRPHLACVGRQDAAVLPVAQELRSLAEALHAPLSVVVEAGGRSSSHERCRRRYVNRLVQLFAPSAVRKN